MSTIDLMNAANAELDMIRRQMASMRAKLGEFAAPEATELNALADKIDELRARRTGYEFRLDLRQSDTPDPAPDGDVTLLLRAAASA